MKNNVVSLAEYKKKKAQDHMVVGCDSYKVSHNKIYDDDAAKEAELVRERVKKEFKLQFDRIVAEAMQKNAGTVLMDKEKK